MKSIIFTIFLSFLLTGCGSKNSDELEELEDFYGVNGFWESNCYEDNENLFYIKTYKFVVDQWLSTLDKYGSDSSCVQTTEPQVFASGNFHIGAEVITESGVTAKEFDLFVLNNNGTDVYLEGYNLIRRDGGQLILGDYLSFSQRPTKLDYDIVYIKQ